MLFGKIWDVEHLIPSSYNEYKPTLNLDYTKKYVNTNNNLNCNSLIAYDHFIIKMYDDNNNNLDNINMCGGFSKNRKQYISTIS